MGSVHRVGVEDQTEGPVLGAQLLYVQNSNRHSCLCPLKAVLRVSAEDQQGGIPAVGQLL